VRRCIQVRSIGGGRRGHAVRYRRRPYRLLQDNDEQSGVYGRGAEGNNWADGSQLQLMRVDAQRQRKSGSWYVRRRQRRLPDRPFLVGSALSKRSLLARRPPRSSLNELRIELLLRHRTQRSSRQNAITSWQVPKAVARKCSSVIRIESDGSSVHCGSKRYRALPSAISQTNPAPRAGCELLESSSRGAKRRGDPELQGALVPLDCFAALAMTIVVRPNAIWTSLTACETI
jgi:hypothetical protein